MSHESPSTLMAASSQPIEDRDPASSGLIDIVAQLGNEKFFIAKVVFFITLAAMGISLLIPNKFTATTLVMPPQQPQSGANSALAALSGLAGGALGSSTKSVEQMYVDMIKSESVQNAVVEENGLMDLYKAKRRIDGRSLLNVNTAIVSDRKSGLIRISYTNEDPVLAAKVTNSYVSQFQKLLTRISVTEAQQRKSYYEQQMVKTKDALSKAEIDLKALQGKSGLVSVDVQTQTAISAVASLRAQILTMEVEVQAKRAFATDNNPDLRRLINDLNTRKHQLAKLEAGQSSSDSVKVESSNLAAVRAFRELKYQEALHGALVQQYHISIADVARDGPLIQQIDIATPPEKKSSPKRAQITIFAFLLSIFLSVGYVLIRNFLRTRSEDEDFLNMVQILRQAWSFKRHTT
jgi:uncharacterized protein involved in exopolysaccharide biosynthesis